MVDSIDLFSYDDQGLNKSELLICICQTDEEREEFTSEDLEDDSISDWLSDELGFKSNILL